MMMRMVGRNVLTTVLRTLLFTVMLTRNRDIVFCKFGIVIFLKGIYLFARVTVQTSRGHPVHTELPGVRSSKIPDLKNTLTSF